MVVTRNNLTSKQSNGQFIFGNWTFEVSTSELKLYYHDSQFGEFCEQFTFPSIAKGRYQQIKPVLNQAFDCLHWLAGVSYYKTALAEVIKFKGNQPSAEQAQWLNETYQAGLAELAFENDLGWLSYIEFNGDNSTKTPSHHTAADSVNLSPRSLVAIGGGKDSLVSVEVIKKMGEDASLFMVGQSAFIKAVAATTGLPLIQVNRQVDKRLTDVNATGAINGHIPITAINTAVASITALIADYDCVVFSNERSADVGNVTAENGQWVNHQYSKSLIYEKTWQHIVHTYIATDLHCFSLLRPFSELAIVKRFAHLPQYFSVFSSCNRNFHLSGSQNSSYHWCGKCPKCAFVFLCLAPFVSKSQLLSIFQQDMLANDDLDELFVSLLGIQGLKPFECVGEQQECQLALQLLSAHPDWHDHPKITQWSGQFITINDSQARQILAASNTHLIPDLRNFSQVFADVT